ncbi:unnamed protein product [Adineta steineri]|uniref:Pentapeptide repeat-containing protein n=1 Tax=Adineta steineri TaxID=433720 RepID=A0A813W042_9BILA|nr:unnamed protein product [Adineta steineri]CAF1308086.1 unnamed protein product [Adineta steineri]
MEKRKKLSKRLNIIKLLLAALPTVAFGVFTIVFTLQQDASAKATREQDQQQADETNRRLIFKEYIDDMTDLLLSKRYDTNINESLLHIRVQTLTVLRNLDGARKSDVIRFLYESHLIHSNQPIKVHLNGSDLTGLKFIKSSAESCDLTDIYLPGVYGENILFEGCLLDRAVFDHAEMCGTVFQSCSLVNSTFLETNLTKAHFQDNQLFAAKFNGALLSHSSIKGGVLQGMDFTNADLYQSDIDHEVFYPLAHGGLIANIFINARHPNGSFFAIDTNDLIVDGQAQTKCNQSRTLSWLNALNDNPIEIINRSQIDLQDTSIVESDCVFRFDQNTFVYQAILLQSFSLLVDQKQALFNFSVLIGTKNPTVEDEISISMLFRQAEGSFDYKQRVIRSFKNISSFQLYSIVDAIPPKTAFLLISLGCKTVGSKDQWCFFDQAKLFVSKNTS